MALLLSMPHVWVEAALTWLKVLTGGVD